MKFIKNKKGITLIALVITIVVMLIIAGITIIMVANGGLFNYAGEVTRQTKTAKEAEQNWAGVEGDLSTADLIAKFTTNKEEDLARLRLYFIGPNGEGRLVSEIFEDEHFKNNEIIADASRSITTVMPFTPVDYDIIKYYNNYYKVFGEEVNLGEDEYDWKNTAVEPFSDAETFVIKIQQEGNYIKKIDGAQYFEYNDIIYKIQNNVATEATTEEIAELDKVRIIFGLGENAQTIMFMPTEGEKWIDWAKSQGEDIDLSSIYTGLTLKTLIQQKDLSESPHNAISYSHSGDPNLYSFEKQRGGNGLVAIEASAQPLLTTDEIEIGGTYCFYSYLKHNST